MKRSFYIYKITYLRGNWTCEDELKLLEISLEEGLKWSNIAKRLGNRTENAVKNKMKSLLTKQKKK